jgi:vitamin B12 transporter
VVISAGAFEASDEKKSTVLKPLDIVTTAGSNGDNYGALKTLPGTQQTNDREGLFVRGGTGAETQTFIDGTWVRNAFSAAVPDLGARGRLILLYLKGTVFSTGGYSALYGGALSSAVILETIDLPERSSANLNLSSVGLGASLQQLSKNKTSSWGVGLQLY